MTVTAADGHTYRVADTHCHVYKQKIAAKASAAIGAFYDKPPYCVKMYDANPTPQEMLDRATQVGVDRFLVFSVATKASQVSGINEFIAETVAAHPEFIGLGTAHQDCEDFGAVLDEVERLGLQGIKLHPDMQKFNLDDPRMMPLYRGAAERGLTMLFHVGDERYDYSAPERLARVMDAIPNLKVHAAHFGCCRIWNRRPVVMAAQVLKGANVAFDTSSTLKWAPKEVVLYLIDQLGIDRIMWGTDFPMWSPSDEIERFLALGLSPEDNQKVFYDNFARFYGVED